MTPINVSCADVEGIEIEEHVCGEVGESGDIGVKKRDQAHLDDDGGELVVHDFGIAKVWLKDEELELVGEVQPAGGLRGERVGRHVRG